MNSGKDGPKENLQHTVGTKTVKQPCQSVWKVLRKLTRPLGYATPAYALEGIKFSMTPTYPCLPNTRAKLWNQLSHLPADEWLKKAGQVVSLTFTPSIQEAGAGESL